MSEGVAADRQIEVWMAMAEHFLDTETRQEVPWTALRCVEAGFTIARARDVWCYEVSPAVCANLWSVAGEWAGWDRDWLAARIAATRAKPGAIAYLRYRCGVHHNHRVWLAIERFMAILLAMSPDEREPFARDAARLARHYFDFAPDALPRAERTRLAALAETLCEALRPCSFGAEHAVGCARVRAALA